MTDSPLWRIIRSGPANGAWNMAVDEAILESVIARSSPPTLRLYSWSPPCLSLGYFQRVERSANLGELKRRGWSLVRRPTGGRAVLHDDELTYSVIAPISLLSSIAGASVVQTYLAVSRGLAAALEDAGIGCEIASERAGVHSAAQARLASAACFDSPSSYELMAGARKIVGSAQTRRSGVLLQHGSIPFSMDFSAAAAVMALPAGGAMSLEGAMSTIHEFAPECTTDALVDALVRGFEMHLMKTAQPGELTPAELNMVEPLRAKYLSDEWNFAR